MILLNGDDGNVMLINVSIDTTTVGTKNTGPSPNSFVNLDFNTRAWYRNFAFPRTISREGVIRRGDKIQFNPKIHVKSHAGQFSRLQRQHQGSEYFSRAIPNLRIEEYREYKYPKSETQNASMSAKTANEGEQESSGRRNTRC